MNALDLLLTLRHAFLANRTRALLTLLGVMIGSGSIVLLAGLLVGGEAMLIRTSQGINETDVIRVLPDEPSPQQRNKTSRPLSLQDAEVLADSRQLGARWVGAISEKGTRAHLGGKDKRITLVGGTLDMLELYRLELQRGRFFDEGDLESRARVCVVGQEVWQELVGDGRPPHEVRLTIEGVRWQVIGVLAHKPTMSKGDGTFIWNRKVVVPQTTYDAVLSPGRERSQLVVRLPPGVDLVQRLKAGKPIVRETLLRTHYGVENFYVKEQDGQGQERMILTVIQFLLLGTSALSLFVGGINIMNIMWVTVSERTREIGIRRALGATRRWIVLQFLSESAAVAAVGGVLGVLGGVGLSGLCAVVLTRLVGDWPFHVAPWSVGAGLGMAVLTGVIFGLMPAVRASKLDPVEALRSS